MRLRCDSCGEMAPDVVGPILLGINKWGEFHIDGTHEGRRWDADVLLCPEHARQMEAFVKSGGRAGTGPRSPQIRTCRGGQQIEPNFS